MLVTTMHHIGVLSDTHIHGQARELPPEVLALFRAEGVELILHAGDISALAVLDQLRACAPVEAVRGNVEESDVVETLPTQRAIAVGGCAIGMVHNLGARARYARTARRLFPNARVVVFGHSHIPYLEDRDGLLLLNPGSAALKRQQPHRTVALLTIANGAPSARLVALP